MVNYNVHSYIIPAFFGIGYGVYIQDVNSKLWKTEDWDGSVKPNAVAVIAKEAKFLIALKESSMRMSDSFATSLERYMTAKSDSEIAKTDYDGAGNTAYILQAQPSSIYAAGWCDAFTFPDRRTKGYLPSLGQWNLAYQNKAKIEAALSKCEGIAMSSCYRSSTFWGIDSFCYRRCWIFFWCDGDVINNNLRHCYHVRPFANL